MVQIFLPEELPWENKGEAGILFGMLQAFERLGSFRLTMPTVNPADLEHYEADGLDVVSSSIVSRHPIFMGLWLLAFVIVAIVGRPRWLRRLAKRFSRGFSALLEAHVILIGHDNFFAYVGVRSLFRYLALVVVAKRISARLVVPAASVGPLTAQKYPPGTLKRRIEEGVLAIIRPVFRYAVLERVDLITLREEKSRRFVDSLPVRRPPRQLTADLAFLMPPADPEKVGQEFSRLGLEAEGRTFAVTADRWVAHRLGIEIKPDSTPREREIRLSQMLARVIDHAVEQWNYQVLLVPHSTGPEPFQDDRPLLRDIHSRVLNQDRIRIMDSDAAPQLLKGVLGRCELVMGTRTHSLIGATSLGVPVVALTHAGRNKTNGIIGDQLGQVDHLVPVEPCWAVGGLVARFEKAVSQLPAARNRLLERLPGVMAAARRNGDLLGELLPELDD